MSDTIYRRFQVNKVKSVQGLIIKFQMSDNEIYVQTMTALNLILNSLQAVTFINTLGRNGNINFSDSPSKCYDTLRKKIQKVIC